MANILNMGPRTAPEIPPLDGYAAKRCVELHRKNLAGLDESLKLPPSPFAQQIMQRGNEVEEERRAWVLANMDTFEIDCRDNVPARDVEAMVEKARRHKVAMFVGEPTREDGTRSERSLKLRTWATHELLDKPGKVEVLWNPRLAKWRNVEGHYEHAQRSGEPDLLWRQNAESPKAKAVWGSLDVKDHKVLGGTGSMRTWKVSKLSEPHIDQAAELTAKGPYRPEDAMQLAHYHRMLEWHGVAGAPIAGIIGRGEGDPQIVWVDLSEKLFERNKVSALEKYDEAFNLRWEVGVREIARRADPGLPALSAPERKPECAECAWRDVCYEELVEMDDVTLLPGITVSHASVHREAGVNTIRELAKLDTLTAKLVDAGVKDLLGLVLEARNSSLPASAPVRDLVEDKPAELLAANGVTTVGQLASLDDATAAYAKAPGSLVGSIDQARVSDYARVRKLTHVFRARGVEKVDLPRGRVECHIDMENTEDCIYLWGVRVSVHDDTKVETVYKPFVTFTGEEAKVFAEMWEFVSGLRAETEAKWGAGSFRAYHYTAAEDRCMRHLAKSHAGSEKVPTSEDVEEFLTSEAWVDLYPIVAKQLVWPTEDHTLKSLAKYVRFFWRDEDPSGASSVLWYQNACDETLSYEQRGKWQDRVLTYNEDDCAATAALIDFVDRFSKVYNPGRKLPGVEELEARYARVRKLPTKKLAAAAR